MTRSRALCAAITLLLAAGANAETVYRRVDADGNVTYSSSPPKTGEKAEAVEIDPDRNVVAPHSTQQTEQLESAERQRYWQNKQDSERQQQDQQAQIDAAEARLAQARAAQEAGQALQPGDLIGKQSGGTRPSPQRTERLQRLDDAVKAAEENLQRARSGR